MPYTRKYQIYSKPVYKSSIIKKVHNWKPKKKNKSKKKFNLGKYWKKKTPDFSKKSVRNELYYYEANVLATMVLNMTPEISANTPVGGYFRYIMNSF